MARRRRVASRLLLAALLPALAVGLLWLGLIPQRLSPFAPLDIATADPWFLDFRLAALRTDGAACAAVLKAPVIQATPVGDQPYEKGCGWRNAVKVSEAAGINVPVDKLSCPMAAALAMWLAHEVQPAAEAILQSRVTGIRHMGSYACRNIVGAKGLSAFRSQHASANALDISAFQLADGRSVSILKAWKAGGSEAEFLHRIHRGACRYFRVAIGPDFNAAHANHFHLDRGSFKSCR